jgi:hypothetical protein
MIIRTVFQPGEELEVSDEDAEVLRLQGLLHTPVDAPPTADAVPSSSEPEAAPDPVPAVADLPAAVAVAKPGPAKTDPPAADSAPTEQVPPTQKG